MTENRCGRFTMERNRLLREWEDLLPIMGNFVVVEARFRWDMNWTEYLAYSPLFEVVPENCEAPKYEIEVFVMDGRAAEIKARRL